jgi:pimeloyl-ACP methyl ester carboxylesterase
MAYLDYTDRGNGPVVLLIHGFPFNQTIWNKFAESLSKDFRVITIDLPALGKSETLAGDFSIENVAARILEFLTEKNIRDVVLTGHSLGGYVALAMAALKPSLFSGLVLFHSTAYPDSAEKKENRNKVIEFVEKKGVTAFTSNFIPPLFANQQHPAIPKIRAIAMEATESAVLNYTRAMRDRPDRTSVLTDFHKPILIISGEKDGGIPPDSVRAQAALSASVELHILKDVAHMGMEEKPDEAFALIHDFRLKSNRH